MNKTQKILSVVVGLIIVAIISITFSRHTTGEIKISALYPLTGGLAQYGELSQKVTDIAVEEINNAGGINGQKVTVVYGDHKCDPKEMTTLMEKATNIDKTNLVMSSACTGTVTAVAPNLQSKNVLLLSTILSGRSATGVSKNFFRNYASDANESKLLATEIIKAGYKKVAIINEETDYAKGLRLELEKNLANTGITILSESFTTGTTDVRSQLTKIKNFSPDVVFVSPQNVTSGEVVLKQMEDLNFYPKHLFVNDNVIKSKDLVAKHRKLMEGAIGGDYIIPTSPAMTDLLAKYKAKYGQDCPQPNMCAVVYDSVNLLAEAIKEVGTDTQKVHEYLSQSEFSGITGNISFDSQNNRKNADYALFTIKDGIMIQK